MYYRLITVIFCFSRNDGGRLSVGILGGPEGALQGLGGIPDHQRGVWRSGQLGSVVLALPADEVHQRHRVSTFFTLSVYMKSFR